MNVWLRAVAILGSSYFIGYLVTGETGLPKDHEAGGEAGGEEAEHEEHHDLGSPWQDLAFWAQLGTFIVLLDLATSKMRPGLASFLVSRKEEISKNLVEAQELRAKAEVAYNEYSARLEKLDSEIKTLKDEMVRAGEAERDRIIAEAEGKATRLRRDAQFIIEQQMKQLRVDLQRETADRAIAAAEQALRAQLTDADQKRLADEFLKQLSSSGESLKQSPGTTQSSGAVQ